VETRRAVLVLLILLLPRASAAPTSQPIDVLDYFLQKNDADDSWTLNGHDVRPEVDPDGTDTQTIVVNKWSKPNCYEVYKVTPTELQIRYEVVRSDPNGSPRNWIRRYEEIGDDHGKFPGHIWMPRHPAVDGTVYLTRHRKDRWVFDMTSKSYVIDKNGSNPDATIAYSFVWANNDWGEQNQSGMELNPTLRLISEWQREGKIYETYDYSRGCGLTVWRWMERVSTLPHVEGNPSGKIFKCENGAVMVEDVGDQNFYPLVHKYDLAHGTKGEQLEVVRFKSHWAPELGEQWYVVYRDSIREAPLRKLNERVAHDFTLPEWKSHPGATIKDLPAMYTTSPPAPATSPSSATTIKPGETWPDDRGQHVQAHGGGIIRLDGTYYWFGEYRGADLDRSKRYVGCYSSKDLVHWTFRKTIEYSDPENLGRGWVLERPKVFFSATTKKFVMYMHLDDRQYKLARVAVATSDTVDGDYTYLKSFRPLDHESRDIGQFIDDDGTAYLIFEDRPFGFRIAKLSDDYLDVEKQMCLIPMHMEGGAVVHYEGLYYAIGSALTGWRPNPNKFATAKSLEGPWSEFQDIAPPETNTYGAQSTMMLKVVGTKTTTVIFMGDMWKPRQLGDSRYLWMPLQIGDGKLWLPEPSEWTLDVQTGETVIQKPASTRPAE
jgi:hypothetical protein